MLVLPSASSACSCWRSAKGAGAGRPARTGAGAPASRTGPGGPSTASMRSAPSRDQRTAWSRASASKSSSSSTDGTQAVHVALGLGQDLGGPGQGPVAGFGLALGLVQRLGGLPERLLQLDRVAQGLPLGRAAGSTPRPGGRAGPGRPAAPPATPGVRHAGPRSGGARRAGPGPPAAPRPPGPGPDGFPGTSSSSPRCRSSAIRDWWSCWLVRRIQIRPASRRSARLQAPPFEPGPAPAAGRDLPAQHHRLLLGQAALGQEGPARPRSCPRPPTPPPPGLRPLAHQVAVPPGPHQEGQGIHQQRLAGPGLAGEDGEAGPEVHRQVLDQGQVLDAQGCEHGIRVTQEGRVSGAGFH